MAPNDHLWVHHPPLTYPSPTCLFQPRGPASSPRALLLASTAFRAPPPLAPASHDRPSHSLARQQTNNNSSVSSVPTPFRVLLNPSSACARTAASPPTNPVPALAIPACTALHRPALPCRPVSRVLRSPSPRARHTQQQQQHPPYHTHPACRSAPASTRARDLHRVPLPRPAPTRSRPRTQASSCKQSPSTPCASRLDRDPSSAPRHTRAHPRAPPRAQPSTATRQHQRQR